MQWSPSQGSVVCVRVCVSVCAYVCMYVCVCVVVGVHAHGHHHSISQLSRVQLHSHFTRKFQSISEGNPIYEQLRPISAFFTDHPANQSAW